MKMFFLKDKEKPSFFKKTFNGLLVFLLLFTVAYFSLKRINVNFNFDFLIEYRTSIGKGFLMTCYLSFASLVISCLIAIISSLMQNSNILVLRYLANIYVQFIRGTPLITQIYLFFYIIGTAWGVENRFLAGVLILSVFEGAYISEILRGSFLSLDENQLEIGKAVGYTKKQRFKYIIFPQLVARTLPALTGQFASIIKDSSLLSIIAVIELTQTMREISATNFQLFEVYISLGILYLILTLPLSHISEKLERKFSYEN